MPNYTFIELAPRKEAKILADYTSIEHDLKSSRNFAELYLTEYPKIGSTDLVDALMVAMIISTSGHSAKKVILYGTIYSQILSGITCRKQLTAPYSLFTG